MLTRIKNYGLDDIKESMRYLLDKSSQSEEVRVLAVSIVSKNQDMIATIYNWVKTNVSYIPDPRDIELFISPVRMVRDYYSGKALGEDCDGQALLVTALSQAVGIKSRVLLLDTIGKGLDHATAEVYSEKLDRWIMVDPSASVPLGWQEKYISKVEVS